ncbi:MAG TPA: sugar ABC transporter ATP-binding protein [Chthoniobacterales bacterium]
MEPLVELRHATKTFPGVVALDSVHLELFPGEIHCLVGENGAGKSTLIKILAGQYAPDGGELLVRGAMVQFHAPADSLRNGIAVIYQDLQLVPHLSVAENISLGQWQTRSGLVNRAAMAERSAVALSQLGTHLDPWINVAELSTAKQQLVEIARALSRQAQVLILDEPTAALSESEGDQLLGVLGRLRQKGLAMLYVSHRLEEVFQIADRITVLRDGKYAGTELRQSISPGEVVRRMVGGDVGLFPKRRHRPKNDRTVMEVRSIHRLGVIENVSFDLHAGEVLGLAGIIGAGRSELAACLFGVTPVDSGEIRIGGKTAVIRNPNAAKRLGIGLVPEDRKNLGVVSILSVRENASLSVFRKISRFGWINRRAETALIEEHSRRLAIKTPSLETQVLALSGGNQQKVVIARWLATTPKILILDEPTQGIDVGAKAEIHELIEELVSSGIAIILISSELPELIAMSDRILVMRKGKIVAELAGRDATKENIIRYAAGSEEVQMETE